MRIPDLPYQDPLDYSDPTRLSLGAPSVRYSLPTNYGPALTVAGGGFAAASQFLAARRTADLLRTNAAIATAQATSENQAGAEQAELYRQHLQQTFGNQTARIGGSGLAMSGSPLRGLDTTAMLGARDLAQIQTNAARKAWGYQVDAAGDEVRAAQSDRAAWYNSLGTMITSGARAYSQWLPDA